MRFNIQNIIFGLVLFIPALIGMLQTESAEIASNVYLQEGSAEAAGALFRLGILVLSELIFCLNLPLIGVGSFLMIIS